MDAGPPDAGPLDAGPRDAGPPPDAGPETCTIDGGIYLAGATDPSNACQTCQPLISTTGWSLASGAPCDGGFCTPMGVCVIWCQIDGGYVAPGPDPTMPGQCCLPARSVISWTQALQFSGTYSGGIPDGGQRSWEFSPLPMVAAVLGDGGGDDLAFIDDDHYLMSVLHNQGGTFGSPVIYPTGRHPGALSAGDLNGDGRVDLAVANSWDGTLTVFYGDGDGGFGAQVFPASSMGELSFSGTLWTADLNGDGRPDLVTLDSTGDVLVLMGLEDGGLSSPSSIPTGFSWPNPVSLVVGHLHLSEGEDLAVSVPSTDSRGDAMFVTILNGDGGFSPPVSYLQANFFLAFMSSGDFNADGLEDLIFTITGDEAMPATDGGAVAISLAQQDGTFGALQTIATGPNMTWWFPKLADLDGDGRPEVITTEYTVGGNRIWIVWQDARGNLSDPMSYTTASGQTPIFATHLSLHGGPVNSVAVLNYPDYSVTVFENVCY
jgi:hypothetical protein